MEVRISENNDYIILNDKHKIKIVGTPENPYFCVKDACRVFGDSNFHKLGIDWGLAKIKPLNKFNKHACSLGRTHFQKQPDNTFYINIVGLFILAETEEYQDAVFEDIFPAIRKHDNESIKEKLLYISKQLNDLMK